MKINFFDYKNTLLSAANNNRKRENGELNQSKLKSSVQSLYESLSDKSEIIKRAEIIAFVLDNCEFTDDETDIFPCAMTGAGIVSELRIKKVSVAEQNEIKGSHLISASVGKQRTFQAG